MVEAIQSDRRRTRPDTLRSLSLPRSLARSLSLTLFLSLPPSLLSVSLSQITLHSNVSHYIHSLAALDSLSLTDSLTHIQTHIHHIHTHRSTERHSDTRAVHDAGARAHSNVNTIRKLSYSLTHSLVHPRTLHYTDAVLHPKVLLTLSHTQSAHRAEAVAHTHTK